MRYSDINIEDIDTYTLNEAKAVYGEGILPLWKDAVYAKPYKIESSTKSRPYNKHGHNAASPS